MGFWDPNADNYNDSVRDVTFSSGLHANRDAAAEYAAVKRSAFEKGARSLLAYCECKSACVSRLIRRALDAP